MHIQPSSGTEEHRTHLVEFDDVGVIQHLHDLNFPVYLLQVYCIQLGLVNDLNGHLQRESKENLISCCSANKTTQSLDLRRQKKSFYNPQGRETFARSGDSALTKTPGRNLSQAV